VSVQDERELRERLDALLSGIEPRPAPVALAVRQGKGIRMRRWGAAAVGLAFVAGGAVALPAMLHTPRSVTSANTAPRYSVAVHSPGKHASPGLIAYGTQDGNRWQVRLLGQGANVEVGGIGVTRFSAPVFVVATDPVEMESAGGSGKGGNVTFVGIVRPDVTGVALMLPGPKEVSLMPVRYLGQRYVAIALPFGVPVIKAIAYDGSRELAYSFAYQGTSLASWWRPGQAGPPRLTKTILAGVTDRQAWRVAAQFGPWGYCFDVPSDNACWLGGVPVRPAHGKQVQALVCGDTTVGEASDAPRVSLAVVSPDVREVKIRLSGGAIERYTPVGVDGTYVLAYLVPYGQLVEDSTAFGASGQVHGWPGSLGCL
jgi:hypothetical protein